MQGSGEYPLSAEGRAQALSASANIRALDPLLVVSSDLARAADTALLVTGRVDYTDPRLRERGAGQWEGLPRSSLEAAHPGPTGALLYALDRVVARMHSAASA